MASNKAYPEHEYNNNSYDNTYSNYDRREDAPLPALPPQQPSSPLDDHQTYHYGNMDSAYRGNQHSDTAYRGNAQLSPTDSDPWDDGESVPMRQYKHPSESGNAPVITPVYDDPFVTDADPKKSRWGRGRGNGKEKRGWFKGKITWVCYILSLIQLIVFIVEIVKNCESSQRASRYACSHTNTA